MKGSSTGKPPHVTQPEAPAALELPWQDLVTAKVASLHYGTVQIVIHDSRVVQVESTERFRFDPPRRS